MYFKIVHKLIDLDFDDFFNWSPSGLLTRGHSLKLELKKCQSDIYKFSFANRCIRCWNSLPAADVLLRFFGQYVHVKNEKFKT